MRLRTHDVRDVEPLLIAVADLDHAQHEHGGADVQRSPARIIERSIAFWRIVDDNHDFRRMSRLVAAALLGHRLPRPPPDRILLRRFCGVPPPSSSQKNMWASWIQMVMTPTRFVSRRSGTASTVRARSYWRTLGEKPGSTVISATCTVRRSRAAKPRRSLPSRRNPRTHELLGKFWRA